MIVQDFSVANVCGLRPGPGGSAVLIGGFRTR